MPIVLVIKESLPIAVLLVPVVLFLKELIPNEIDRNQIKKIIINESKGNNSSKGTKCD